MIKRCILIFVLAIAACTIIASGAQIRLSVMDSYLEEIIPEANVEFSNNGKTYSFSTSETGIINLSLPVGNYHVVVSRDGYLPASYEADVEEGGGTIIMRYKIEPDFRQLGELTVSGKRYLTTFGNGFLSYNLSADSRAQGRNLLSSLNLVPLLSTSAKGEIEVKGTGGCLIYLNGRPYNIAMADPATVLASIKAEKVKTVEVITDPQAKYGTTTDAPIINIITDNSILDGLYNTISIDGNTLPKAHAGDLFMGMRGNIRFSISYDYDFNGQYNQPVLTDTKYTSAAINQATSHSFSEDGNAGNWQTHTPRVLVEWSIDSLRTIYADAHAKIETSNFHDRLSQQFNIPDINTTQEWITDTHADVTAGNAEANLELKQYFRKERSRVNYLIGYRYSYNPDRRDLSTMILKDDLESNTSHSSTDGGMHQHSIRYYQQVKLATRQYLGWNAYAHLRNGHSYSETQSAADMHYTQNIFALNCAYAGTLFNRLNLTAGISAELEYFKINQAITDNAVKNSYFNILPYAILTYYCSQHTSIQAYYYPSIKRPSIAMLNPYVEVFNPLTLWQGNPALRPERQHRVQLMWNMYTQSYYISVSARASIHNHAITPCYFTAAGSGILSGSYVNIDSYKSAGAQYYASYTPIRWLKLSISGLFNHYWLNDAQIGLRQKDWEYHLNANCNIFLPQQWSIAAKYGRHKGAPMAFATNSAFNLYTISIEKSFLQGSLTAGLFIDNVFNRYNTSHSTIEAPGISSTTIRKINARDIGLKLTYTISRGSGIDLKRQQDLAPTDIESGVR